ncbi:MAG: PulJ/GspJ family protein [Rhodanobacteraceae bacterium]
MSKSSHKRGLTLIELMIAVAILAVLFALVYDSLVHLSTGMSGEIASSVLNQQTERGLDRMMQTLRSAKFQNLADTGGQQLEFYVPVDPDQDGDSLDSKLNIEWGQSGSPTGDKLNAVMAIRFVKTSTYSEASHNYDLNRDGNKTESFDIGHLEQDYYSGATVTGTPTYIRSITPDIVIQKTGQTVADLNGDGTTDPIFLQNGNKLQIRLYVTNTLEESPRFQLFETSVPLRNQ